MSVYQIDKKCLTLPILMNTMEEKELSYLDDSVNWYSHWYRLLVNPYIHFPLFTPQGSWPP